MKENEKIANEFLKFYKMEEKSKRITIEWGNGNKKTIRQKYKNLPNIQKYFTSPERFLTVTEIKALDDALEAHNTDQSIKSHYNTLTKFQKEFIGENKPIKIRHIIKRNTDYSYTVIVYKNDIEVEVVCPDKYFSIAKRFRLIETETIKRI